MPIKSGFAKCIVRIISEGAINEIFEIIGKRVKIRKRKLPCVILTGDGAGSIPGAVYAPDTTKKAICAGFGSLLLCAGWFLQYNSDQTVMGRYVVDKSEKTKQVLEQT